MSIDLDQLIVAELDFSFLDSERFQSRYGESRSSMASIEREASADDGEPATSTTVADLTREKGVVDFNSQTDYMPKKKIITVKFSLPKHEACPFQQRLMSLDIPSLFER